MSPIMKPGYILQIVFTINFPVQVLCEPETKKFPLLMPNILLVKEEPCYCTPVKILPNKTYYIVGFEQIAAMDVVHHMVLFGCSKPGSSHIYWDCCQVTDPCAKDTSVIYAWSLHAKDFELPDNVAFQIGKGTSVQFLVLQIHYGMKFEKNQSDSSGLNLIYTEEKQSKLAGVLLLEADGVIPPHTVTHMEIVCRITEKKTLYPLAYRVHTHELGRIVTGYRVRRDRFGLDHWTLLAKGDPQMPQMFYPAFDKGAIQKGDKIAARCTMNSTKSEYVSVGHRHENEMCNFYLMYYVKQGSPLDMKYCTSEGPPDFYWSNKENDLNNIPGEDSLIFV